jgi:hypothetical protein
MQLNNKNYNDLLVYLKDHYNPSAWLGHMEFAMWLVNKYKPDVIVDLGVDYGHSTFSLASEGIGKVYGVDYFEGDMYTGYRNTYETVTGAYNFFVDRKMLQRNNIEFIKGKFNDVVEKFKSDNIKIDLLHIDGLHTFDAISNDFETWSPLVSENGIIIMHDVYAFPDTVGKYFKDITLPKTLITNSAGLGIVCRNENIIKEINKLWVHKLKIHKDHLTHDDYPEFNIKRLLM